MIIFVVSLIVVSMFAGIGIKAVTDRIWPPPVYVTPGQPAEPAARHTRRWDDTMDVLADGFDAGRRSSRINELAGPPGVVQPGGGWISGPMLAPIPPFQGSSGQLRAEADAS